MSEFHDYDFTKYKGKQPRKKIANNLVDYEARKTILDTAMGIVRKENENKQNYFNMTEALKIAKRINKLSDVNVFENSRSSKVVEVRSLLNKILYDFKNMTLAQIRDFYRNTGKPMDSMLEYCTH